MIFLRILVSNIEMQRHERIIFTFLQIKFILSQIKFTLLQIKFFYKFVF